MNRRAQSISLLLAAGVSTSALTQAADLFWPYNQPTQITFDQSDLEQSYQVWKSDMISSNNAGGNGRYRVKFENNAGETVSEGIGYGMILTSLFDDQTEFDGLWLFAKDHFDDNGLMHWKIGSPGQINGEGAATDAEVDMAIALINACVKANNSVWPTSTHNINYCADANTLIENIYQHEVDKSGNELLPGDLWTTETYPDGIVNLSYFSPGYFRVFGAFTEQENKWQQVIDRNYEIANLAQNKPGNCSNLISNWNTYNGDPQVVSWQSGTSRYWGWDAARFAWRVAVDAHWYSDNKAVQTTNELASFFASVGMSNMGVEYSLDGQRHQSWQHMFFDANAASSIFAASQLTPVTCGDAQGQIRSNAQQAYDVVNQDGMYGGYYGGYWRLISMMLMTGNFPNLYALANNNSNTLAINMTQPAPGAQYPSGSNAMLSAQTNQDSQVSQVDFFIDGVNVAQDSSAPFSVSVSGLSNGEHSAYAVANNYSGQTASSGSVSFSLGNSLPVSVIELISTQSLSVTLNGNQSSDADGNLVAYQWNFGDGSTANGNQVSHTYASSGNYTVTLTVIDDTGDNNASTLVVNVGASNDAGNSDLECTYRIANEWSSGFTAQITLQNKSSRTVQGWEVQWTYSDGTQLANGWNANFSGTTSVTATNPSWNANIGAGQSVSFGFNGNKGIAGTPAAIVKLSGASCM
ncbi:MAG: glycosyl hydrolase family 8 [Reinekea sp.]